MAAVGKGFVKTFSRPASGAGKILLNIFFASPLQDHVEDTRIIPATESPQP